MTDDERMEDFLQKAKAMPASLRPRDVASLMRDLEAGRLFRPRPELLVRSDGAALLIPGAVHSLAAEPESGKGWIATYEAGRNVAAGRDVLVIDFEETDITLAIRLRELGVDAEAVRRHLTYVSPEEAITAPALAPLVEHKPPFAFVVVDGVGEAFHLMGLNPNDDGDAAGFLRDIPRPLAARGAAVLLIDHVVKDREARGRYAAGSQRKLAGVQVAFGAEVVTPFDRRRAGAVRLVIHKDRSGSVRPLAAMGTVAIVRIEPVGGGELVRITVDPPDEVDEQGTMRPVALLEALAAVVAEHPGMSQAEAVRAVRGRKQDAIRALHLLVDEGWIERRTEDGGRARFAHFELHRFDASAAPPVDRFPPVPDQFPEPVAGDRFPGSPPVKGEPEPGPAPKGASSPSKTRQEPTNVIELPKGARARRGAA